MPRTKQQRRSKGDGTVYRSTLRTRSGRVRDVWRAELQWTNAQGLEQRRSAQRASEAEALAVLRRWQVEIATNGTAAKQRVSRGPTFSEYALAWLARRLPEVGANTYRQYEGNLRLRLLPSFGKRLVKHIAQDDVSRFLANFVTARKSGPNRNETGETTRKQCLGVLKQILADAVDEGVIDRIPFAVSGRRRVKMRVARRELHVLDAAQQRAFVRACSGHRFEALFVLALTSGMREGELLAQRWRHVGDDHVVVQRRLDARTRASAQTKSRSSTRRIELDEETMAQLRAHRVRMEREGLPVDSNDLVFPNRAGNGASASNLIDRDFRPLMVSAGLPENVRFHDLRHSHATLLLSNGVNPKVVQERLGHDSVKTTLDLYGHVLPTSQREAAKLVDRALFAPIRPARTDEHGETATMRLAARRRLPAPVER